MAQISSGWPVNAAGEIVVSSTVGTDTVVVGTLPEAFIPVQSDGKAAFAGLSSGGGSSGAPTAITTSRAAVSGDNGNTLVNSTATNIVLTINTGMPSGFGFATAQLSTGTVQIVAGAGVTVNGVSGFNKTSAQYGVMALVQVGTNAYVISGATA